MKKERRFRFKSVYARFALIFLGIWWGLNAITVSALYVILQRSGIDIHLDLQRLIGFVYLSSAFFGTLVIILAVRGIVKPIKKLSTAAKEVSGGNYGVAVDVKSGDEIGRLAEDFNTMVQEIGSVDALRREFVSNVSHEFRSPITSIKGYAKLINEDSQSRESTKEYSQTIINESDMLMNLSSNLLRLSELDSQVIHAQNTFSLDEQIRQVILLLHPTWDAKLLDFNLTLDTVKYTGDEELLRQVWLNLIQNAIKFSNEGGTIHVALRQLSGSVQVSVTDEGIGIAAKDIPHLFDRFYKSSKSRSGTGNGLGLSIVKKIVDKAGGTITVKSELGEGTRFIVELPVEVVTSS